MKNRREFLAIFGAAVVAGCSGGGEGTSTPENRNRTEARFGPPTPRSTTEQQGTQEPGSQDTTEGVDTAEETEPEQDPEPEPEPEPDPVRKSFDQIYEEEMVRENMADSVPWDTVRSELEDDGHDLSTVNQGDISSEFIEDLAGHAGKHIDEGIAAAALAYGLHEEFNIDTDKVIVEPRTFNGGLQAPMASILIQDQDGAVHKDMYRPLEDGQKPDLQGDVVS